MNAISYLKSEHDRFRRTLTAISKAASIKTKKLKFDAFTQELIRHETMEQRVWYPFLQKNRELKKIIAHLVSEEKSTALAIKKFKKVGLDFMWELRYYKFKHDVEHHANEEEKELFPKVNEFISKEELNRLGKKMREFKATLKSK